MKIRIIYTILLISLLALLSAQEINKVIVEIDLDPIKTLKEGTIAIVLNSEKAKIKILEELLKDTARTHDFITRTAHSIKDISAERDRKNKSIMNAFEQNYDFSQVVFVYDYMLRKINSKDSIEVIRSNLSTETIVKPYKLFFAKRMRSPSETSTNIYAWKIHDDKLTLIPTPFPNSISISSLKSMARSIFKSNEAEYEANAKDIALSLNRKFNEYYQQVVSE